MWRFWRGCNTESLKLELNIFPDAQRDWLWLYKQQSLCLIALNQSDRMRVFYFYLNGFRRKFLNVQQILENGVTIKYKNWNEIKWKSRYLIPKNMYTFIVYLVIGIAIYFAILLIPAKIWHFGLIKLTDWKKKKCFLIRNAMRCMELHAAAASDNKNLCLFCRVLK